MSEPGTPPTLGQLAEDLASLADPVARGRARAFAAELLETHAQALARLVELVDAAGEPGARILRDAVADPLVSSLLVLHDLHPDSREVRVARALEEARAQLGPLGAAVGDATLDGDDVVVVVEGAADSPQARVGVEALLARLLHRHAPDVEALRLVGAGAEARGGRRLLPLAVS